MSLSLEILENAHAKHLGYGLPCSNCRAYYAADLTACPICGCSDRVPAKVECASLSDCGEGVQ
jgi:rRNA maturation endonuclease Nob1